MKNARGHKQTNNKPQSEKRKRGTFYFSRVFDKYNLRDRAKFTFFCRCLIFVILCVALALMIMQHVDDLEKETYTNGWRTLIPLLTMTAILLFTQITKLIASRRKNGLRYSLYVLEALTACLFALITNSTAAMFVYILVLTEYYIGLEKKGRALLLFIFAVGLYISGYILQNYMLLSDLPKILTLLTRTASSVFVLIVHFIIVQIALAFYNQFVRLDKAMEELMDSKQKLEKAYEVVAEMTAMEERQRIAKDIHDTAGHSLTTVIMQTESAKWMIDRDPKQAKSKIIAANLQAKHALEELRDSVHVLSDRKQTKTLKAALEQIIHESTDGTGITIRSEIEEMQVSSAKHRFLCNTLKEGISNGLRHGNATAFWCELKRENNAIRFLLSDNGKGVELNDLSIGFGLTGMKDRAKSLGGTVAFHSEMDEGFELEITLPIDTKLE